MVRNQLMVNPLDEIILKKKQTQTASSRGQVLTITVWLRTIDLSKNYQSKIQEERNGYLSK